MNAIIMNLIFNRLPMKPKEEGIYWCIVKTVTLPPKIDEKLIVEYHYSFIEFKEKQFNVPKVPETTLEVVAWCELQDPEPHFKPKMRIITH